MLHWLRGGLVSLYTGAFVGLQGVPGVTPANGAFFRVLADVLATPVAVVTGNDAVSLIPGQLEPWAALTSHPSLRGLSADVGAAMLLVHTVETLHRAVDACVLVVTQEKPFLAATLVAPHGVDTCVLAASIVKCTLIHIQTIVSVVR